MQFDLIERFAAIAGLDDRISLRAQRRAQHQPDVRLVVYDQHARGDAIGSHDVTARLSPTNSGSARIGPSPLSPPARCSVKLNRLPTPSVVSSDIRPPCASTISFA